MKEFYTNEGLIIYLVGLLIAGILHLVIYYRWKQKPSYKLKHYLLFPLLSWLYLGTFLCAVFYTIPLKTI